VTNRRTFTCALLSGLAAMTHLAEAQPPRGMYRLGILGNHPGAFVALVERLRELGYTENQNLVIERRYSEGRQELFPQLAGDLVRLNVDLIVTSSTPASLAAQHATRTIPIVMQNVADPVGSGLVASLGKPGGNITGFSNIASEIVPKQLGLIKELVPAATRVAILWSGNPPERIGTREAEAARAVGVTLHPALAHTTKEIAQAFDTMVQQRADALLVYINGVNVAGAQTIYQLAARYRLPAMYQDRDFTEQGGLASYGANVDDLARRAGDYVDRILKGTKAGDLPVEQPKKFELVINRKTASLIGLTIPQSLLLRADEVIQ